MKYTIKMSTAQTMTLVTSTIAYKHTSHIDITHLAKKNFVGALETV